MRLFKILIGNAVFAALVWSWWGLTNDNRDTLILGIIFITGGLLAGTFIGYALNVPVRKKHRVSGLPPPDPSVFDQIR